MGDDGLGPKGRLALAAALGTGVVIGAAGLVVYQVCFFLTQLPFQPSSPQRMSQNVGLRVTGPDFSQELATLTTHIAAPRADLEQLKEGSNNTTGGPTLKSALKRESKYGGRGDAMSVECLVSSEQLELPDIGRRRNQSWGSGLTAGSASSSGTEYFSAYSGSDEENGAEDGGLQLKVKVKVSPQSVETEKLARLDDLMEGSKEQQTLALNQLLSAVQEGDRRDPNLLWRLCKAQYLCSVLENQDDNKEGQHKLIMEAINSGEEALGLDSKNSEAHKWFAIALGSRGEFGGVKEKILDGFEFKKHIDMAAEFNPKDHFTQHLLGRFCYEVSQLSWIERMMAATLFAAPPTASLPEAVQFFLQAERLKPEGWKENRLFLAKCYIGLWDYATAVAWLDRADAIPMAMPDVREGVKDKLSQKEVEDLLSRYSSYRAKK